MAFIIRTKSNCKICFDLVSRMRVSNRSTLVFIESIKREETINRSIFTENTDLAYLVFVDAKNLEYTLLALTRI